MSIRELRTLLAVAEYGSISSAAERLFMSLPAASSHISKLEDELRTPLLDRMRKPARLTAQAQALIPKVRLLIDQYDTLQEAVSEEKDLAGSLSVGSIPTALTGVLPRALLALRRRHPRLKVRLEHGLSPSLTERLRHRELDAAIVSEPRSLPPMLKWTPFAKEPVVVIAQAGVDAESDDDLLRSHPYIRFNRHFWISRAIEDSLRRRRIILREVMELDSLEAIGQMVRHGLGVSVIPLSNESFLRFHRIHAWPFDNPGMTRQIGLAELSDSSKQGLTSVLVKHLLKFGGQKS